MGIYGWLRISFFNLLLVALLGCLLRYKIAFSFPIVLQKNVLHSHSHFAFNGWLSQTLMVLMLYYLGKQLGRELFTRYKIILWMNLFTAYGMLVSFILEGYAAVSIIFSTLSILISYVFAFMYWRDLNKVPGTPTSHLWFKAGLIFNVLSSFGAFSLAFMMATKTGDQRLTLSGIYYFLHFQYNGWFFFACMGLLFTKFKTLSSPLERKIFWLFAVSCVPAYFLSVLWAAINPVLYWIVVLASLAQALGWIYFIQMIVRHKPYFGQVFTKDSRWLLWLSLIACTIKIGLQLFSVIPFMSQLAFGFRPIVIGYLHLVLLGVISLFLIGFIISNKFVAVSRETFAAIAIFVTGIILNEIVLMTQGIGAISDVMIPNLNVVLFIVALVMFSGLLFLNLTLNRNEEDSDGLTEGSIGRGTSP